ALFALEGEADGRDVRETCLDLVLSVADHDDGLCRAQRPHRLEDMAHHRPAADREGDLGPAALHPGSLSRGENHRGDGTGRCRPWGHLVSLAGATRAPECVTSISIWARSGG